jgi:hypothetical protein
VKAQTLNDVLQPFRVLGTHLEASLQASGLPRYKPMTADKLQPGNALITPQVRIILHDSKVFFTVSASGARLGVSLSLPRLIGTQGMIETLDVRLSSREQHEFDSLVWALSDINLVA